MRQIPFSPPDFGQDEIDAVVETLKSGWITTGPRTKEFEMKIASYCNTRKAVCLQSATAAMELTLRLLGIGPGDEVITSAYTYTASASVIHHVGATIILVDTEKDSFHLDIEQVQEKITSRTKAIISVDIAGVLCGYAALKNAVESKKHLFEPNHPLQEMLGRVAIISDSAHAFGAKQNDKMCGELADFTCFSFHAVKNLTTGEGGAVTWNLPDDFDSDEIYKQFMIMSLHGQTKDALAKTKAGSWEYDIIAPYYKANMTDIMAALGLSQLKRYDALMERRRELVGLYEKALSDLPVDWLRHPRSGNISSCHLFLMTINNGTEAIRNQIIEQLSENGISSNVHYKPLPLLTAYKNLGFRIEDYPNAFAMFKKEITLPLHTLLTNADVKYITLTLRKLLLSKDYGITTSIDTL